MCKAWLPAALISSSRNLLVLLFYFLQVLVFVTWSAKS